MKWPLAAAALVLLMPGGLLAADSEPAVVPHVDLARYMGVWYEIATIPNWMQKGCTDTIVKYTLRPDGDIDVLNTCWKKDAYKPYTGHGKVIDAVTDSKWFVKFFLWIGSPYWIVDLDPQYQYAAVGVPDRSKLWIISRTLQLDDRIYAEMLKRLTAQGFDIGQLVKTAQTGKKVAGLNAPPAGETASPAAITVIAGKAGVEWVAIAGGSFRMWSDGPRSKQPTQVQDFQMAKTAVTNAQYKVCVEAGICKAAHDYGPAFDAPDQPVVGVDWYQAEIFSKWVGGRLPTEAEWQYAARSRGKESRFDATCDRGVLYDKKLGFGCGRKAPWPVCSKPKGDTDQGLCDMSGNVIQWLDDAVSGREAGVGERASSPHEDNERTRRRGDFNQRLCGTPWDESDFFGFPSSVRYLYQPDEETDFVGFRPVRQAASGT